MAGQEYPVKALRITALGAYFHAFGIAAYFPHRCRRADPVAVTGDGGFGQYPWEVTTAVKYGMNITHVLLHNDELGKISKEQRAGGWDVWQTSLTNPSFAAYAELCGAHGRRVTAAAELPCQGADIDRSLGAETDLVSARR